MINLGNNRTISLADMVRALGKAPGVEAKLDRRPEQPEGVPRTWGDVGKPERLLQYAPETPFDRGLQVFIACFETNRHIPGKDRTLNTPAGELGKHTY